MRTNSEVTIGDVQKTLLLPLWGRAIEMEKSKPLLIDKQAASIIKDIPYDFSIIAKNTSKISQLAWISRSIYFDNEIKKFIEMNPESTVLNIGCGLDTTFERIDNGLINWFDLDLPDVIELRRKYISETERRKFIAASVFEKTWFEIIEDKKQVLIMIAGVLYYFEENEIKELFISFSKEFPGAEIIFDYSSRQGVEIANKQVIDKSGMEKTAYLKWGIDDIDEFKKWGMDIEVINNMPMFKEFKKNYPIIKRIGMNFSDKMKIMSLAHLKLK